MLAETRPTAVRRLASSLTLLTTSWSFCTKEAMETFLSDRKAMLMHAETTPRIRWILLTRTCPRQETYEVWELLLRELPSE